MKKNLRVWLFQIKSKNKIPGSSSLGKNIRIKAKSIHFGANVRIGNNVKISCQHLSIGSGVVISDNVHIGGLGKIQLGDYTTVAENVHIDGFKDKNLKIGSLSWICRNCILNCSDNLTIGNGSCIGIGSKIFTHGAWFEAAEGYSLNFKEVRLGSNVWLALGVIVQPGAIIHDNVLVNSGAVVSGELESGFVYSGVPAKAKIPISQIKTELTTDQKKQIIARYLSQRLLASGWKGEPIDSPKMDQRYSFSKANQNFDLVFAADDKNIEINSIKKSVYFLDNINSKIDSLPGKAAAVLLIDISSKKSYGSAELEMLILPRLNDFIFRFYPASSETEN